MKFRITEAVNRNDGKPIFYVYQQETSAISGESRWAFRMGGRTEAEARAMVERLTNPLPERVIDEIEVSPS